MSPEAFQFGLGQLVFGSDWQHNGTQNDIHN
jgi:hypothetical protein